MLTNGKSPGSSVIFGPDGALYGTTTVGGSNNGVVFKMNRDGTGYQVLHAFRGSPTDGGLQNAIGLDRGNLIVGKDHFLYGATSQAGASGFGAVFKISESGNYQLLHHFDNSQNDSGPICVIQATNSLLYGTTISGIAFSIDTNGNNYTVLTNLGATPLGGLLQGSDGGLYGTTIGGSIAVTGVVFRLNLDGSGFQHLHDFTGPDGARPIGSLIQIGPMLAGVTRFGGATNQGTIYFVGTNGGSFSSVYSFGTGGFPNEGTQPGAGLVVGPGGMLFGMTLSSANNPGTLFKINPDGSGFEQLYLFTGAPDGRMPFAALSADPSQREVGVLYGTTTLGGVNDFGTIFALLINPPLSITPVASQSVSNQTALFWPSWALHYTLQSSTNLNSGTWEDVTNGTPVTGVQLPNPTNSPYYYRLVAPN